MYELELIEANPDPTKSAVMTRAGELVAEGYSRSDAVSAAWDDILGDEYEDEEEEEDLDIYPVAKSKSRRNQMTENPITSGTVVLGVLGAYLVWCAVQYAKTKIWSWRPWGVVPISRRITATTQAPRVVASAYDNDHHSTQTIYRAKDSTEESIRLIVP